MSIVVSHVVGRPFVTKRICEVPALVGGSPLVRLLQCAIESCIEGVLPCGIVVIKKSV